MAWLGQKDIQTSKYPHMALNLNVWDIVHSGSTLTFKATVRAIVTSGNIYYDGVAVSLTSAGTITGNMNPVSTGGYVDFGTFNGSANVGVSATSYTLRATLSAGNVASGYAEWVITFGSGGSAPTGGSITNIQPRWDRITATIGGVNWGGLNPDVLELKILKSAYVANVPARQNHYTNTAGPVTTTVTNQSDTLANPTWYIKGCGFFYTGLYAQNTIGVLRYQGPTLYTPPAPSQFTYTDPGTPGTKNFAVTFTGSAANTDPDYDASQLTRTVRYKIDNGNWVYLDNATQAAVDSVSNYTISVPAGSVATVEGWMNYRTSLQSEVSTFTLANTNAAVHLYGSVNAQSEEIVHLYGSVGGRSKKIKKLYASVGGVAKKVFEDV